MKRRNKNCTKVPNSNIFCSKQKKKKAVSSKTDATTEKPKKKLPKKDQYKNLLAVAQQVEAISQGYDKSQEKEIIFDDSTKEVAEEIVKKHQQREDESWWQALERKRKEKKKEQKKQRKDQFKQAADEDEPANEEEEAKNKAKLELLMMEYNQSDTKGDIKGFNLKKQKDKERSRRHRNDDTTIKASDEFEVDLQDDRFTNRLIQDPEFSLDPTHTKFRKTKSTQKILDTKRTKKDMALSNTLVTTQQTESNSAVQLQDLKRKLEQTAPIPKAKKQRVQ